MKYPKKHKGVLEPIKIPVKIDSKFYPCLLFNNGDFMRQSIAEYDDEYSCWVVCMARNKRLGYEKKEVLKIIKKYYHAKKSKEIKKGDLKIKEEPKAYEKPAKVYKNGKWKTEKKGKKGKKAKV